MTAMTLVPTESLISLLSLINPPPVVSDGKTFEFRNPNAAGCLAEISKVVQEMLKKQTAHACGCCTLSAMTVRDMQAQIDEQSAFIATAFDARPNLDLDMEIKGFKGLLGGY